MTDRGLIGAVLYAKDLHNLVQFYSVVAGLDVQKFEKGFAVLGEENTRSPRAMTASLPPLLARNTACRAWPWHSHRAGRDSTSIMRGIYGARPRGPDTHPNGESRPIRFEIEELGRVADIINRLPFPVTDHVGGCCRPGATASSTTKWWLSSRRGRESPKHEERSKRGDGWS